MPGVTTTNLLSKKLGAKLTQAHAQFKDKPAEIGNVRLPDGIENGVAQLVDIKIGEYKEGDNKGQPFFMAQGIMIEPAVHNGASIAGMRTTVGPIPLCDTPKAAKKKTFADHYADFLNELKKLGVDTAQTEAGTPEQVESFLTSAMTELKRQKPHFRVRTWKGKATTAFPNPRVNEEWNGLIEHNGQVDPSAGVDDGGAQEPAAAEMGPEPFTEPDQGTPNGGDAVATGAADDGVDWDLLAATADSDMEGKTDDGKAAIKYITELAQAAGHSNEAISACNSWSEVLALAQSPPAEPEAAAPVAKVDPVKGAIVSYKPDKKKPAVQCEVTSVSVKDRTVTLKLATGAKTAVVGADKKLLKVKWDDLE